MKCEDMRYSRWTNLRPTNYLSDCHHAPVRVEGTTTNYFVCTECNEVCDLWVQPTNDEWLDKLLGVNVYQ